MKWIRRGSSFRRESLGANVYEIKDDEVIEYLPVAS